MADTDIVIPEVAVDKDDGFVDDELKGTVPAGDAEGIQGNPNSIGYGIQQIKLEYWNPENEKYWEVRGLRRLYY
eukprot:136690-Ditylum_brightwellii.AAC.1